MVCKMYKMLFCVRPRVACCGCTATRENKHWARIGLASSEGDLPRRIVAYAYGDQEDSAADT